MNPGYGTPVDKEEVENLISVVEVYKSPYIDGRILSFALKMIYWCGLRKKEILDLKVGDVRGLKEKGDNKAEFVIKNKKGKSVSVRIPKHVRPLIVEHLKYLEETFGELSDNHPLIPTIRKCKEKTSSPWKYGDRKFTRDLRKCTKGKVSVMRTGLIRRAGIIEFFRTKKEERMSDSEALKETAHFARIKEKQVDLILTGKIDEESVNRLGRLANQSRREFWGSFDDQIVARSNWSKQSDYEEENPEAQLTFVEAMRRFHEQNKN